MSTQRVVLKSEHDRIVEELRAEVESVEKREEEALRKVNALREALRVKDEALKAAENSLGECACTSSGESYRKFMAEQEDVRAQIERALATPAPAPQKPEGERCEHESVERWVCKKCGHISAPASPKQEDK